MAVSSWQQAVHSQQPPTPPRHHGTTAPRHHGTTSPSEKRLGGQEVRKEEKGEWIRKPEMPDQWMISYDYKEMHLKFRLGLTAFGHIGVFPEQAENWNYIYDLIQSAVGNEQLAGNTGDKKPDPGSRIQDPGSSFRVLNLFAYTGGASLAAKAAGADVVHVDSVKQVINWAREDMENSNLDGIRWVIEDAIKFVRREVKRGNHYDGIILDPPAYGRGPDGEKWILEDSIDEMIALCNQLLSGQSAVPSGQWAVGSQQSPFFILSLYSMGFSSLIGENLVRSHFSNIGELQTGELCFPDRGGRNLPLGTVTRFY
ncbi:class I SAM-dependent methyltransferase [Bacteroidota bacterium]